MQAVTLTNATPTGRQLTSVIDFGDRDHIPHNFRDDHAVAHHVFDGHWRFENGPNGFFYDPWLVAYFFDDGTIGVSRREHIDQALEALGKQRAAAPLAGATGEVVITDAHRRDIAEISREIGRQARDRGWCGEYEAVLRGLNRRLAVPMTGRDGTVPVRDR